MSGFKIGNTASFKIDGYNVPATTLLHEGLVVAWVHDGANREHATLALTTATALNAFAPAAKALALVLQYFDGDTSDDALRILARCREALILAAGYEFRVDLDVCEVRRDGEPVHYDDQPADVRQWADELAEYLHNGGVL